MYHCVFPVKMDVYVIGSANCIKLNHKMWLHCQPNYYVTLRPLLYIQIKLQSQMSYRDITRSRSDAQNIQIKFNFLQII
jgi:hypothetical protein